MIKRTARGVGFLVFGLFFILLVSCGTKRGDEPTTSAATAHLSFTPTSPSTPTASGLQATSGPTTPSPEATLKPTDLPPTEEANFITHTVQPGETLLGLARQYDVPMAAIQLQNEMGGSIDIFAGDSLTIPPSVGWEGASPFWTVHVVEEGETLIEIARAYDLEPTTLQSVNGLVDADIIGVRQDLMLPLETLSLARTPVPTPVPKAAPTADEATVMPATSTPAPTAAAVAAGSPPADVADWPRETVRLINEVRAQHGLPPLTYNETLAQAAQAHANDCAQRGRGSHTGSDGSDIKTRILRAGYDPASWAECWAQRKTPAGAVEIWMDEVPPNDPHRRTLLTTWLSEIGMGVAKTDWGYYFIADFGRPR